jgi:hypothetical protein
MLAVLVPFWGACSRPDGAAASTVAAARRLNPTGYGVHGLAYSLLSLVSD